MYRKPGSPVILVVPVHARTPLKKGLFHALLAQAQLTWP